MSQSATLDSQKFLVDFNGFAPLDSKRFLGGPDEFSKVSRGPPVLAKSFSRAPMDSPVNSQRFLIGSDPK